MRGKITFKMKTDNAFYLANYLIMIKITQIRENKSILLDRRARAIMRTMNHLKKAILTFLLRLDNFSDEIKSGEIQYEADPKDKGGDIIFTIESTRDKVETFCKYRIKDRAATIPLRPLLEIKREIYD